MTHAAAGYRFVDPRALAALRDLELAARTVVDGVMLGVHRSARVGAGLEFSQYRAYQPGDDLRRVDWKLFGRSDRYFVREAETETSLTVRILLDATGSMAQEEDGLSKFDYARFLAAALALLAVRQGDAVGLAAANDDAFVTVRPGRGQRHLHRVLHALEDMSPAGTWPAWDRLERELEAGGTRGITVVITDVAERADEIRLTLRKLAALRHDVLCVHVVGRRELELGWSGAVTFEELETGRQLEADADRARAGWRVRLDRELQSLRVELEDRRIAYARVTLDDPLDEALRRFLRPRDRAA